MIEPTLFTHPVEVHPGDIWQLGRHRLLCGDSTNAQDVERLLQGEQYDLCFADPPYGIGFDKWDVPLANIQEFVMWCIASLSSQGFFALTHQLPRCLEWLNVLECSALQFKDHVVWVKRANSIVATPLFRTHESLFIYGFKNGKYVETKGLYADVKTPGILCDVVSIEAISRHISDLQLKIKRGYGSLTPITDDRHASFDGKFNMRGDSSPEYTNFTNVWSFLPEHRKKRNGRPDNHPTAKPVLLVERLLALCSSFESNIYDPFAGSGVTFIAAENMPGERCVYGCEISPTYCETIIHRWQDTTAQQAQLVEREVCQ